MLRGYGEPGGYGHLPPTKDGGCPYGCPHAIDRHDTLDPGSYPAEFLVGNCEDEHECDCPGAAEYGD